MNTETGKLIEIADKLKKSEKLKTFWDIQQELIEDRGFPEYTPVAEEDMTEKQKETKQVSKHDNRSKLGKKYKVSRQVQRRIERENAKK